jgi:phosphoglycolate phosphatase-like HAD superfamily hydrolase
VTRAVVFDLDGTLVNLPIDYEKLFQEVRERAKISDVNPITKTVAKLDAKTKEEIFKVWDRLEAVAWQQGNAKKAGISLYHKFSKETKALVTMQGKTLARNIVGSLKLSFDVVVTREDSLDRAEQLRIAARKLNVSPKDVLFIGNTEGDSVAAKIVESKFLRVEE